MKSQSFYNLKCRIEVQTIIYRDTKRGYNNCTFDDISLYFDTVEFIEDYYGDCSDYSFNIDEAQQVIKSLQLAQEYIKSLKNFDNELENKNQNQMYWLSVKRAGQKKLKLISRIPYGNSRNEILIDVAQNSEISSPLIRLIFSYNQCFCFAFTVNSVNQFIDGLTNAIEYAQKNRPTIIADIMIGKVAAVEPPSQLVYLEVGTDGIYFEGDEQLSGVFINKYEGENRWMSRTHWFEDEDLLAIARGLEKKANEVTSQIVALHFNPPSKMSKDALVADEVAITIEDLKDDKELDAKAKSNAKRTTIRANDHQIFWFTKDNAKKMSKFMLDAFDAKKNHTPHKYVSSQPTTLTIADLPLK